MVIPVILSGGSGSRLWPLSRELNPKQFLPLVTQHSMLQETLLRLVRDDQLISDLKPLVVCNESHRFLVAEQLRELDIEESSIILEPVGRNTAPAIAVAAFHLQSQMENATMLVLPADHVISDLPVFHQVLRQAQDLAAKNHLVTFGIVPDSPETGYGYIKQGETLEGKATRVARFVEKPDLKTAGEYLQSGEYLWNSGMFMFRCDQYLNELQRLQPDIYRYSQAAYAAAQLDSDFIRLDETQFSQTPADSIDYAVMEKTEHAVVLPLDAQWNDVGAWDALWAVHAKNDEGNVITGDVILKQVKNSYVHAGEKLVAAIGMEDCIIVETADAVLVASKQHAQQVKEIVQQLKTEQREEAMLHQQVYRPWGSYETLVEDQRFKVKRIIVNPSSSLSLQMHHHRAEHWVVVKGTAKITQADKTFMLTEDQSTYIPLGTTHRLENPGVIPLEIIEIQSGSYLGEDDIVRFSDTYGRA